MRSRLTLICLRVLRLRLIGGFFAVAAAFGVNATSVLPLDLDQLTASAQEIVHVRCLANQSVPDAMVGVATITTFAVLDRAKGAANSLLAIRQAGGTLNGQVVNFRVPKFTAGAEYVLFMPAASTAGLASPVGLAQGVFGVFSSRQGKEAGNGRSFDELLPGAAPSLPPASAAARAQVAPVPTSRMELGAFMTMLRAKAAGK